MLAPRPSYLASLAFAMLGAFCLATLRAIFDVTVQDYWKDTVSPFLQAHVGPWSTTMLEWIGPYWAGVLSAFVLMFAIEIIFAWRRRKRGGQASEPEVKIDRHALADEAEDLSAKILALHAQFEGRRRATFIADARSPHSDGSAFSDVDGMELQRYAELYATSVTRVVRLSRKCISVNEDEYHWLTRRISGREIGDISLKLGNLAVELRYSQPDIPGYSPFKEAQIRRAAEELAVTNQFEDSRPQSPEDTELETRP